MRAARLTLLASTVLVFAGCNGSNTGTFDPGTLSIDPATATFAAALNVDIKSMTRTADSLYYKDLTVGTGATAAAGYTARVTYTGWLINGVKFDGSDLHAPNYYLEFLVNTGGVIKGWDEGVQGMKVGGKRQLVVPPQLGYGSSGSGGIPGNAILVFEVTLLKVL
jgi:FKBP-type peptidyl-prolyl cis-trans isomerase